MKIRYVVVLCIAILTSAGCASVPARINPQFTGYFKTPKNVYIMPSEIKQYKLTAGGVIEEMDDWEDKTDAFFQNDIKGILGTSGRMKIDNLDISQADSNLKDFIREQNGLYQAVAQSIIMHTYLPVSTFQHKINQFDYSLGPEVGGINKFMSVDTLLFVGGKRTYWTGGRILVNACAMLAGAAVGVAIIPAQVPDWLAVSLVDAKTGNIIWFRYLGQPEAAIGDLREKEEVAKVTKYLFKDLTD